MAVQMYRLAIKRAALPPTIISFSPSSGPVGSLITITGTYLGSPTSIAIGTGSGSAIVVSDTLTTLVAMVMPGANGGNITVLTDYGSTTSANAFTVTSTHIPAYQQGNKIIGTGNVGPANQGFSASLSADGNTAIVGAYNDNAGQGAAWVYTRTNGTWTQQGGKLVGNGNVGEANQGYAVALSADGNTAIIGGKTDSLGKGCAWIFVRRGGVWWQQGNKLVGTGGLGFQGCAVALSADGNTAAIGGYSDNSMVGATWVFTRSLGAWSQQGGKLVGSGYSGQPRQGMSVAISSDGNTIITGGNWDNVSSGAVWVFVRNANAWTQQGNKLVVSGIQMGTSAGVSVGISADGNTVIVGGYGHNNEYGSSWIFTRTGGVWTQQGNNLFGIGDAATTGQGFAVSLSADGNTALIGAPYFHNSSNEGASWLFKRTAGVWTQQGNSMAGTSNIGGARRGYSVCLSADGSTAITGGYYDNGQQGAAWMYSSNSNAGLRRLTINAGSLSPVFDSATFSYTDSVINSISSITVTPEPADPGASMQLRMNGGSFAAITNGNPSGSLALNQGSNILEIKVTAPDGISAKTYSVAITRLAPLSADANLSMLALSLGALSPAFSPALLTYFSTVSNQVSGLTITASLASIGASMKVRINGGAYSGLANGSTSPTLLLNVGNNLIEIVVTAQDGSTQKVYSITVKRSIPSGQNAYLNNLTISSGKLTPAFYSDTLFYAATVNNNIATLTVKPTSAISSAIIRVQINGNNSAVVASGNSSAALALNIGSNAISVTVLSTDFSTTKIYMITVNRLSVSLSSNADLSGLTLSEGILNPSFLSATTVYTSSVANGTTQMSITPIAADTTATIGVALNGNSFTTVISGYASDYLPLSTGTNLISVRVRAQDTTTIKIYSITVIRSNGTFIIDFPQQNGLSVYPNPTQGLLHFEMDVHGTSVSSVTVFNAIGKPVFESTFNLQSGQLNLSNLPYGTYFLRLVYQDRTTLKPFVIGE